MPEIEDLVNYAIIIGLSTFIILLLTGNFIELSIERQTSTQNRATINILQNIVTNSPFLIEDSNNNKLKLLIDKSKYDKGTGLDLQECCSSIQYDYSFFIYDSNDIYDAETKSVTEETLTNSKQYGSPIDFNQRSSCYSDFNLGKRSGATLPINICKKEDTLDCTQGQAYLETVTSPLSQLSFWISQACNSDYDINKTIIIDPDDYKNIQIKSENEICIKNVCKKYECPTNKNIIIEQESFDNYIQKKYGFGNTFSCDYVEIQGNVNENLARVQIFIGKLKDSLQNIIEDLPKDYDMWTEDIISHYTKSNEIILTNEGINDLNGILIEPSENNFKESKKYISIKHNENKSVKNAKLILDISKLKNNFNVDRLDCDNDCINFEKYESLNFDARYLDPESEDYEYGLLRWELLDSNGMCIEQYNFLGRGLTVEESQNRIPKDIQGRFIISNNWQKYSISIPKENHYNIENCPSTDVLDIFGQANKILFPKQEADLVEFNFQKIKSIKWSVCKINYFEEEIYNIPLTDISIIVKPTCAPGDNHDTIQALMIDNLYFKSRGNEI